MRKNDWKQKLNDKLDSMAYDIPTVTGCSFFWGEVKMPAGLREDIEKKQNSSCDTEKSY